MAPEDPRPATSSIISLRRETVDPAPEDTTATRPPAAGFGTLVAPHLLPGLLKALRRRWLVCSIVGLVVGGLVGALAWLLSPEQYSAETRLQVKNPWHGGTTSPPNEEEPTRFERAQVAFLHSPKALEAVLRRPEVADLPSVRQQSDPLTWLQSRISVEAGPAPDTLRVRLTCARADDAVALVQAIAEVHQRQARDQREVSLRQIKEAVRRENETLRQKRQRLERLDNARLAAAEKDCQQARFDLRVARTERTALEQRRASLDRLPAPESAVLDYLKEDAAARERLKEWNEAEERIKQVLRVSALKERDPSLPEFYRLRDEARAKHQARRREVVATIERQVRGRAIEEHQMQLDRLDGRIAMLEDLVKSLQGEIQELGGAAVAGELKALREEIATANDSLRKLTSDLRAAEAEAAHPEGSQPAENVTVRRNEPIPRLGLAGFAGAGACALIVLAVSWREFRLRRITAGSDIQRGLGIPVIGNVPPLKGRASSGQPNLEGQGDVAEAVDALRTLLLRGSGGGPHVILITSAVAGEGKTSLAAWLAASLARAWRKTLLIDGDLRKPQAHSLFQVPLEPGLSEVLRGEAETADAIQPTSVSRLWMIPAGHWDAHAIQALAQEGAGRLFDQLKDQHDFIVVDACPVLPVADVLLLSEHVDVVLLSVRSGLSRLPFVHAARQRLATLDVPVRGAVLMGPDGDLEGRG